MGNKNDTKPVIGMDLGGTKILAGVVASDGRILSMAKRPTRPEAGVEKIVDRMVKTARQAIDEAGLKVSDIAAVGSGSPGPLDSKRGVVVSAPNLAGWSDVPLVDLLAAQFGIPVFIENDVNLGTLGEYALGAGQGTRDLVGIFIGTGIGGGLILDGKLRQGWRMTAAELGHMILMPDGPLCGCGNRGCVEALASRTAIERDIWAGIKAGRTSIMSQLMEKDSRDRMTSGVLAAAVEKKDPLVTEVLGRAQFYLGLLVASVVNLIDPERVVLGGGVVEALGENFLEPIRAVAYQNFINKLNARGVKIVPAKLGDTAALLGAAVYARSRLENG
jgi:glucokinase